MALDSWQYGDPARAAPSTMKYAGAAAAIFGTEKTSEVIDV